MDPRFLPHNTHLEDPARFAQRDPQLRLLARQVYVHRPALLGLLPGVPGIYTVGGGRQVGKTTLLKQWVAELLGQGTPAEAIAFLSGELIDDHHTLLHLLQAQLAEMPQDVTNYLLVDEVSYIRDWDKAVKYAADAGFLEGCVLVLTGSDLVLIQEARMRLPGRRGEAAVVDFHLYPLSFREAVGLKRGSDVLTALDFPAEEIAQELVEMLFEEFGHYLTHGGYLTAINDLAKNDRLSEATLATYSDWIRGDVVKRGRHEHYLREFVAAVIKRYGGQLTWNALARDLSIDHPKTVADYAALLASMDALFIQPALLEDRLTAAPKKARKLMFTDPFIFHAVHAWLFPATKPYEDQIRPGLGDPELVGRLAEACVATHYRRLYPTYYIKSEGEVDVAYVDEGRFWPVEVKWTGQLRPKELKQAAKYANARILNRSKRPGRIQGMQTIPLPLALARLG